jgi:hypothetical protein
VADDAQSDAAHAHADAAEAAASAYDLVAVVYYHSPQGALRAVDGQPLSVMPTDRRRGGRRRRRRNGGGGATGPGHYTAAVFRPDPTARTGVRVAAVEGEGAVREGGWWVCDDEQVRGPLRPSDHQRLVANEAQMLLYRRRRVDTDCAAPCKRPQPRPHAVAPSTVAAAASVVETTAPGSNRGGAGGGVTRTRVVFGDEGDVVSTTRELVG